MDQFNTGLGGFLLREAAGMRSRDVGQVQPDAVRMVPGVVLGQVTATGVYKRRLATATDGSQTPRAILGSAVDPGASPVRALVLTRDMSVLIQGLEYDTWSAVTGLEALGVEVTTSAPGGLVWDGRPVTLDGQFINVTI
jgi:hypothetical protein